MRSNKLIHKSVKWIKDVEESVENQVAAGSNQLFTGSIDGVDNIFSEKL